VAGGADEVGIITAVAFNALRAALASGFEDSPERASRPFDAARTGFVLSGGSGVLVLEALASARARGARPLLEIVGFGANSDDHDMVLPEPSGKSAADCMVAALTDAGVDASEIDYVNAHGTGTPFGDAAEIAALRSVFGNAVPPFSSTKSLGGHALGAAGGLEAIHSLLMMRDGFLAASANVEQPDPAAEGLDLLREVRIQPSRLHLSNSFGFGGTNATLVLADAADCGQ
jgi:3-oxoacyl-[acyl-carrier-protein] synthase-1